MAKRTGKRSSSVLRANPRNYSNLIKESAGSTIPVTPQATGRSASSRQAQATMARVESAAVDWKGEYAYVLKDLRWLLGVSVVLFALIIGAGFVM